MTELFNLLPMFEDTKHWPALWDPAPRRDPTLWFFRRKLRWRSASNRNECNAPILRVPPGCAGKNRIRYPTIWKRILRFPYLQINARAYLMVLSELPLTTSLSRYCKQAMPRLCPFNVRINSHVEVFHTFIVRSPDAETMYFSSKSTTLTAALCPTSTLRKAISDCDVMSQTAIDRSWKNKTQYLRQ
jgi:hypothetical protein